VELPDEEERRKYIEYLLKDENIKINITIDELPNFRRGSAKGHKGHKTEAEAEDVPISFEFIKEKKHSVLKKEYGDVLEFIYPEISFEDIGGMERAKNYLLKNIVEPIKKGDLDGFRWEYFYVGRPVPGNFACKCSGKVKRINCVKIDMSRILGHTWEKARRISRNAFWAPSRRTR